MPIMGWLRNQDNSIEFSQYHKWFLSHSKIYTLVNNDHPECPNVNFTGVFLKLILSNWIDQVNI